MAQPHSSTSSTPAASPSPPASPAPAPTWTPSRPRSSPAIADAELLLFVVDAKAGITAADHEVADMLRALRQDHHPRRQQGGQPAPQRRVDRVLRARPRRPAAGQRPQRRRRRRAPRPDLRPAALPAGRGRRAIRSRQACASPSSAGPTSASRRSSTPSSARSASSSATSPAPPATPSTRPSSSRARR